ncbi:MAG: nitroreductase family protein, partial [Betaproteobacteria bacterium]|nr:nitroreductase family protein [Betaproteobacteria bacterium]
DTGMAALSLGLEALAQGLVTHQMGGFDMAKARAAFAIPEEYTPMAMIAVGYQAAPEALDDEETRAKELKPRGRKPVAERFYGGSWNAKLP